MPWQKSVVRTLIEPLAAAILLAALARTVIHVYTIPSASMVPTLHRGDHILVVRYLFSEPDRGDVVVFESSGELLVKRVVALPGDLVDSRLGRLRVGGYTVPEPYLQEAAATGAIEAQVVAAGSYFVMGDNRAASVDSRSRGSVPRDAIVGRARVVLWSSSPADGAAALAASAPAGGPRLFKWIR